MAERSVFISKSTYPFFEEIRVEIDWFGGFALSQKRKCQIGLHKNFLEAYPDMKVLEISSASTLSLGAKLSAMNLCTQTEQRVTSVESKFQSSKRFRNGKEIIGPFPKYMFLPGKECKKLVKEAGKGLIAKEYFCDGMMFYAPEHHISQFYDFIYLNALLEPENQEIRDQLLSSGFTAFSDLATKSLNCQARSAAIFVGLVQAGRIDEVRNMDSYLALFRTRKDGQAVGPESYESVQLLFNDKVRRLSPIVPCVFHKEDVEAYYAAHCWMLTNKKEEDNFLDKKVEGGKNEHGL